MKKKYNCYRVLLLFVVIFSSCVFRTEQPTNLDMLSAVENAFVDIAANSKPAIVGVMSLNSNTELNRWGSGFFFREDGYILTNDHIVHGGERFRVRLLDGSELEAKLVGTDIITDVGVLKVEGEQEFPFLPLADSEKVRVGQFAIASVILFDLNIL